jgi:hypothetical protein
VAESKINEGLVKQTEKSRKNRSSRVSRPVKDKYSSLSISIGQEQQNVQINKGQVKTIKIDKGQVRQTLKNIVDRLSRLSFSIKDKCSRV